jgi:hypothetical protein
VGRSYGKFRRLENRKLIGSGGYAAGSSSLQPVLACLLCRMGVQKMAAKRNKKGRNVFHEEATGERKK